MLYGKAKISYNASLQLLLLEVPGIVAVIVSGTVDSSATIVYVGASYEYETLTLLGLLVLTLICELLSANSVKNACAADSPAVPLLKVKPH